MTTTILYFTFLTNYIYLFLILWHQRREYKIYLFNFFLASVLNIFCLAYHKNSTILFSFNAILFFLLIILPIWMTKKISTSLSQSNITQKTILYAKWRYLITQSSIHQAEYQELREALSFYHHIPAAEKEQPVDSFWVLFWKKYPVTLILMLANLVFFFLTEIYKSQQGFLAFLNSGVNSFEFVFYQKEYWRLISAIFLHFDYIHLGMNLFGLYCMAPLIEKAYGKANFLIIYFVCGFLSSLASISWRAYQITLSMGASGAVCGLMGAYFFLFQKKSVPVQWKKHQIFSFWFTVAAFAVIGYFIPQMDNAAHFCGLFAGVLLSYILKKGNTVLSRLIQKIFFIFLMLFVSACMVFPFLHLFLYSYPAHIKEFSWYSILSKKEKLIFPVPFSWKPDFLLSQRKFILHKKENPLPIPSQDATFWDNYQLGYRGELFVKMSLHPFSLRHQIRIGIEDISFELQKKERISSLSSIKKIGGNLFYTTEKKFFLTSLEKKVSMISASYLFSHDTSLYQWKFQYPEKQKKEYEDLIEKILQQVHFQE